MGHTVRGVAFQARPGSRHFRPGRLLIVSLVSVALWAGLISLVVWAF